MLKYDENRWLKDALENDVKTNYEKYFTSIPKQGYKHLDFGEVN